MAGVTNKGKYRLLGLYFVAQTAPTNIYYRLHTNAVVPGADTNTASQLTQITAGNGYTTGGYQLARNGTDFDVLTEDDTGDQAYVQAKDMVWTASGGPIPASGDGISYGAFTDDNVTEGSREIVAYHDLSGPHSVSSGQTFTVQNAEVRLTES